MHLVGIIQSAGRVFETPEVQCVSQIYFKDEMIIF
jgi:hypothetical protein